MGRSKWWFIFVECVCVHQSMHTCINMLQVQPSQELCFVRKGCSWHGLLSCMDCAVADSHSQLIAVFVLPSTICGSYKGAAEITVQSYCPCLPHIAVTVSSIGWARHIFFCASKCSLYQSSQRNLYSLSNSEVQQ